MEPDWTVEQEPSERELRIIKLCKKRRLFVFLRLHRHLIFDPEMVEALYGMYSGTGRLPEDPVRLALAMLLQVAFGEADNEVPALTAADLRWRMVLGLLDTPEESAFSQGTVFNFRQRAIQFGFAKRLLSKTVEVARETKGFSHKRLRAVFDSSPLLGAGRVEDTINLIGRAIRQLVEVAASEAGRDADEVADELLVTVASASSVKAALDIDWRTPEARNAALNTLLAQFRRLQQWLEEQFSEEERKSPPLSESISMVEQLIDQDTEPDPDPTNPGSDEDAPGSRRVRQNKDSDEKRDRRISISDPDMRHGRKSKTKLFAGYKRHVAVDADVPGLVNEVALLAANVREHEGAEPLLNGLEADGWDLTELHSDRGYLPAEAVHERRREGLRVVSKPPTPHRSERIGKDAFQIDFEARTATCPDGQTTSVSVNGYASFPRGPCSDCSIRSRCLPASGRRQLQLHPNEQFFREMAAELATPEGRAIRRERVVVEHALAHVGAIQGKRARFKGKAKNLFDLQRTAAVNNLYVIDRMLAEAA